VTPCIVNWPTALAVTVCLSAGIFSLLRSTVSVAFGYLSVSRQVDQLVRSARRGEIDPRVPLDDQVEQSFGFRDRALVHGRAQPGDGALDAWPPAGLWAGEGHGQGIDQLGRAAQPVRGLTDR